MTLVLSLVTPDYVIQVSDRRLVCPDDPNFKPVDTANKTVLFCSSMTIAYTGIARIGNRNVDDYLVEVINDQVSCRPTEVANYLAKRLTQSFRAIVLPREKKRQTFVGVGWAFETPQIRKPFMLQVSNCYYKGQYLAEAEEHFTVNSMVFTGTNAPRWAWKAIGVGLNDQERKNLNFAIRKVAKGKRGSDPFRMTMLLFDVARRVSERDFSVGKELLATMIPRATAGAIAASILYTDSPTGSAATVESSNTTAQLSSTLPFAEYDNRIKPFGPVVVCPKAKMMGHMQ
jgi:hypothetical protein